MKPFSPGDTVSLKTSAGPLDNESSADTVAFMSDFNIPRDRTGLALATQLKSILDAVVLQLQADETAGQLPDHLALRPPTVKKNPLG